MTLTLTVDEPAWQAHLLRHLVQLGDGLVPVVKGNGYGLGRRFLAEQVAAAAPLVAVGTVYETADVADVAQHVLVLTPTFDDHLEALAPNVTLTVASIAQARHLVDLGWSGPVVVKLVSSMLRHGFAADRLAEVGVGDGLRIAGYAIHPPLDGSAGDHLGEIERLAAAVPAGAEIHVSHLGPVEFAALRARHPERIWRLRLGTTLWHGDKSMFRLGADVLDVRPVAAGTPAGYRLEPVPCAGHLVIVGAGSAHGVTPLADGRSPFHFARRRLALHEAPHMHATMAFVPAGEPCPEVGASVDVQRPLISITPDRVVWIA